MDQISQSVSELVEQFSKLPGVGKKSAERLAYHVLRMHESEAMALATAIERVKKNVRYCQACFNLTEADECSICRDPRRDRTRICVVEQPRDLLSLEGTGAFKGLYHVLGGKISPLNGVDPEDLRISELEARLTNVNEIILALGTDVEGDATSNYLAQRLGAKGMKVTRIAHGLPAGSGLEYADDLTLSRALEGRRELS